MTTTKTLFAGFCIATVLASCTATSKTKGIVTNAAIEENIQSATIVSDGGDTLSFSNPCASIDQAREILPGDTVSVIYSGTYHAYMVADSAKLYPRQSDGGDPEEIATEMGSFQTHSYVGLLPAASCPGIEYKLTIRNREHSGNGTFQLALTYKEAENGEDRTLTYNGKRLTLRGIPGDDNATVWQCITDDNNNIFNFLRENANTLTLLNDKCEKAKDNLNYSLRLVE